MFQLAVRCLLAAIAVSLVCSSHPSYGMQYTLRVLSSGASSAEAINDDGIVVGSNGYKPYRWDTRAGTSSELHASRGIAMAVNELGAACSPASLIATTTRHCRSTKTRSKCRIGKMVSAGK